MIDVIDASISIDNIAFDGFTFGSVGHHKCFWLVSMNVGRLRFGLWLDYLLNIFPSSSVAFGDQSPGIRTQRFLILNVRYIAT